eukprot:g6074.t1
MARKADGDLSLSCSEEIRVAMIGNVDSGKSTLIGVLCAGKLDDGRGAARSAVFTHQHENVSGRTSAISHQLIGYKNVSNNDNEADEEIGDGAAPRSEQVFVDIKKGRNKSYWRDLMEKTDRQIQLFDLCGHRKYLKTTIFGLTGMRPDFAVVLVGSNMGVPKMTREHVGLAVCLRIPLIVVVTKVDICPPHILKQTMANVKKMLRQVKKQPYVVNGKGAAKSCMSGNKPNVEKPETNNTTVSAANDKGGSKGETSEFVIKAAQHVCSSMVVCPIFITSNVTGRGIADLRDFLALLRKPKPRDVFEGLRSGGNKYGQDSKSNDKEREEKPLQKPRALSLPSQSESTSDIFGKNTQTNLKADTKVEGKATKDDVVFQIDSTFQVQGVGIVVSGSVFRGRVKLNDTLLLGPDKVGQFVRVVVRGIHASRVPLSEVGAGRCASFAIRMVGNKSGGKTLRRDTIRKGMVLLGENTPHEKWCCREFEAEVIILHHQSTIGEEAREEGEEEEEEEEEGEIWGE